MPRTATRRRALAAALACAAMLSACTGNSDDGTAGTGVSATPVVAADAADTTAASAVGAAATSSLDGSAAGAAARSKAFVGAALTSANAYAKTLPGRTAAEKADAELATTGVKVLALSRAGDAPAQILAQTTLKKTGAAVLVLLVGGQPGAPFKAAAVTPMLPDAKLDALDPTTDGSAAIADGKGLSAKPDDVVSAFAASVKYPDPTATKVLADDPLSEQLRQSARAQSQALNNQGAFTQEHEPKGVIGGLRLKDGNGAIVFAHLVRSDAIAMRTPVKLTPAKDLTLLTGIKQITTEANLTSDEIVAIVIPASGQARIVAASDQLVAGSGR
ncbi:hypothetical protein [Terrabacter sp. Ter38]|uniref:hypothetical protein n=1 Tax=Terrabacter sp. Ter38 TaxID=2926030 RepID=UPI002118F173|nr:hypothetical protein [Terrabacter sp. Ter38]